MIACAAPLGFGAQMPPVTAHFMGGREVPASATMFLTRFCLSAFAGFAPSAAVSIPAPRPAALRAIEPLVAAAPASRVLSAGEMIKRLKVGGLPISAIADALAVERKTIYSWAEGGFPNPANADRLQQIFDLLGSEPDGHLRYLHRMWERTLPSGGTLRALLLAPQLDVARAKAAVDALRPAVERAARTAKPTLPSEEMSPLADTWQLVADSRG